MNLEGCSFVFTFTFDMSLHNVGIPTSCTNVNQSIWGRRCIGQACFWYHLSVKWLPLFCFSCILCSSVRAILGQYYTIYVISICKPLQCMLSNIHIHILSLFLTMMHRSIYSKYIYQYMFNSNSNKQCMCRYIIIKFIYFDMYWL